MSQSGSESRNSEESERSLFMRWWSTFKSTVGDEEAASYAAWCAWLERGRLTQSESGLRPEDQFSMGDPHPCDMTAEERERAFAPSHEGFDMTSTPNGDAIAYALRQLERNAKNKSEYADAILDFWQLDQEQHRFQIHARVFKGMDLIGYIESATNA